MKNFVLKIILFLLVSMNSLPLFAATRSEDINVRDTTNVTISTNNDNAQLEGFISSIRNFFYTPVTSGDATVSNFFIGIAGGIKNFFVIIAVLFLIIGVMKLLFSGGDEEKQKKWKNNIIWVSVGIFFMQIGYSVWYTLILKNDFDRIDSRFGWLFWANIFEPIINLLLLLASFGFIAMAVYAFYTIITGGGDEEKLKKGKNIVIYALIGFLLIRVPKFLVTALYGEPSEGCRNAFSSLTCEIGEKNLDAGVNIFGKILVYISSFLALFAVIMTLYAGWLIVISGGDEEKLKKAKNIIIFIAIGVVALIGSQALFRFFFLQG